jgi:hypothetical protein
MIKLLRCFLIVISLVLLSACNTPQTINSYSPGESPLEGYTFEDVYVDDSTLEFELTIALSKDTSLEETIQPRSLELLINEQAYAIGDGFGEVLKIDDDFNVKVDGVDIVDLSEETFVSGVEYTVVIQFDLLEFENVELVSSVENIRLIIVFGTITVSLNNF